MARTRSFNLRFLCSTKLLPAVHLGWVTCWKGPRLNLRPPVRPFICPGSPEAGSPTNILPGGRETRLYWDLVSESGPAARGTLMFDQLCSLCGSVCVDVDMCVCSLLSEGVSDSFPKCPIGQSIQISWCLTSSPLNVEVWTQRSSALETELLPHSQLTSHKDICQQLWIFRTFLRASGAAAAQTGVDCQPFVIRMSVSSCGEEGNHGSCISAYLQSRALQDVGTEVGRGGLIQQLSAAEQLHICCCCWQTLTATAPLTADSQHSPPYNLLKLDDCSLWPVLLHVVRVHNHAVKTRQWQQQQQQRPFNPWNLPTAQ